MILSQPDILGCYVCFGDPNSPLTKGLVAGIVALLVVLSVILILFVKFFLNVRKRTKQEK